MTLGLFVVIIIAAIILLPMAIRILKEYERGVMFRLGRLQDSKGPGVIFMIPFVDRMVRVSLRTLAMEVPPQDVITRDNVSMKVNAVVYFRIVNPSAAVVEVENYLYATSQLAQTVLRSVCGQVELDELLSHRDRVNRQLQDILDKQTDPWGIKVSLVETKDIDLPADFKRVMARQAEAERERRAKVINAEGEAQAAARLAEAAGIMESNPMTLHLRFLQTISAVSSEKSSFYILPIPLDVFKFFVGKSSLLKQETE